MTASARGESLSRHQRLRRRQDFLRCYRRGRKRRGSLATLHFYPGEPGPHASERNRRGGSVGSADEQRQARLGITASRKVGNAVVRGKAKRRVREIFRRFSGRRDFAGLDLVVHLWPNAGKADFTALRSELERLFDSLPRSRSCDSRRSRG